MNGSRCTIYTAFYETTPVVVKVVRKDVQDKDIVRQVCATVGFAKFSGGHAYIAGLTVCGHGCVLVRSWLWAA